MVRRTHLAARERLVLEEYRVCLEEANRRLAIARNNLSPREVGILRLRHGWGKASDHTLQELSERYHLTRERIRQIEVGAIRKLRAAMWETGCGAASGAPRIDRLAGRAL